MDAHNFERFYIVTRLITDSGSEKMKAHGLSEKQKTELLDKVGKLLVEQLDTESCKTALKKFMNDYVKKNKLDVNPSDLLDSLSWSVKVQLKH